MPVSLTDIMATLQNGVTAISKLTKQISVTFPQATALSTIAPSAGSVTFTSSQAATFLTVITSSGATYHVPLY